jgi:hypothetical protein
MANKIQLRRDTTANWENVNPILADGEPGLDITTNQVKYGDGANAWVDLSYASGGAGLTDVDGVVTFPGDLLIGTLWPEDPMPEGDKESVVWAKDDTEYLGLWWGGDQTYPEPGYGPVAGIMIGAYDDMTDDFTGDPSPADTNITIAINDSTGTTLAWVFDRTGNLTLPEGGTISETGTNSAYSILLTPYADPQYNPDMAVKIYPTFSDDDHIHITAGNVATVDLFLGDDDQYVKLERNGGNVVIGANADTHHWTFGTNGNITFPDSTTQSTAFNITKFGEGFSLNGADKIVTNKLYSTNATEPAQHYRLELDTNGVVVLPDQSIINGSTIRGIYGTGGANYSGITIGPNVSYQEESWMYVDYTGAYIATNYNTDQKLWQFDNTGNLTLPAGGEIKSAAGTGNVVVQSNDGANTYNWTFETNGNLTFPDSTTQSTAYKRTTSSWNVAVGSATYNFTVPLNGTYSMWVKGAIDNGIIVWNATGTVTNSNVPVVGQQYAWNYTGGGTPIEITAMPTQFVGTGNTIVSSNPSVGSNSNVFNFTINNTSGEAKTVYWGYVAQ